MRFLSTLASWLLIWLWKILMPFGRDMHYHSLPWFIKFWLLRIILWLKKWGLSFFSYLYWTILSYVEVPWCCLWSRWRYFNWECFPKFSHYQFWASNNSLHSPSLGWLDDFRFIRSRWMHWTQLLMTLGVFNTLDSLALCPFVR